MPVTPQSDSRFHDIDRPQDKEISDKIDILYHDDEYINNYRILVENVYLAGSPESVINCFLMRPPFLDGETTSRLAISLLRIEAFEHIASLFRSYQDINIVMPTSALLALIEGIKANTKHEGELKVWPEAGLPDAAQTTIYHAQSIIISRQRTIIDNLLSRL